MADLDIRVACPGCGEEGRAVCYESVNVTLDPEKKVQVLDGSLFLYTCPACGKTVRLDYPLLYHDMRKRLLIRYNPAGEEADEDMNALLAENEIFGGSGYNLRLVSAYEGLLEKIRIFDYELDDRVLELCKLALTEELAEDQPQLMVCRVLMDMRGEQVYVVFVDEDGDSFATELPEELYNQLFDALGDVIEECTPEDTFAVIDADWAYDTARMVALENE